MPKVASMIEDSLESNCSMIEKTPPKEVSLSDFLATFAMPVEFFMHFLISNTKISEKYDMSKSWATICCSGTLNLF